MANTEEHGLNVSRLIVKQSDDYFVSADFAKCIQKTCEGARQWYDGLFRVWDLQIRARVLRDESEKAVNNVADEGPQNRVKKLGPFLEAIQLPWELGLKSAQSQSHSLELRAPHTSRREHAFEDAFVACRRAISSEVAWSVAQRPDHWRLCIRIHQQRRHLLRPLLSKHARYDATQCLHTTNDQLQEVKAALRLNLESRALAKKPFRIRLADMVSATLSRLTAVATSVIFNTRCLVSNWSQ